MRRTVIAVLFLLLLPTLAPAAESRRYIVSLERGVPATRATALLRDIDADPQRRDIAEFSRFGLFAATLTDEEAARLSASSNVRYVEPVVERHILGASLPAIADALRNLNGQTVPFGIDLVRARDVWPVSRGAQINVAVIDTGVQYTHPDIAPNWAGGYNAITKSNDPMDDNGHGTHVSGTIAAADNAIGVVGVAPAVRLWGVKALNAQGSGSNENVIAGLNWIIDQKKVRGGNWIVNLSLGSSDTSNTEREAFRKAIEEGLIVVAASGNESMPLIPAAVSYPAAYPGVLAVGAVNSQSQIASFSNQGPELAVVAPGVDVLSTVRMQTAAFAAVQTAAKTYGGAPLTGAARGNVSGEWVFCGIGLENEFPASVRGRIAVIRRGGEIKFHTKVTRALAAGATAVVIVNHDTSALSFTLFDPEVPSTETFAWPVVVAISLTDGAALIGSNGGSITVANQLDDYSSFNGTSMSSPHVAGVAALAWSIAPTATPEQIRLAITSSATDLGANGRDAVYGYGLVHALDTAKQLAPGSFNNPSKPVDTPSGRRVLRRGSQP